MTSPLSSTLTSTLSNPLGSPLGSPLTSSLSSALSSALTHSLTSSMTGPLTSTLAPALTASLTAALSSTLATTPKRAVAPNRAIAPKCAAALDHATALNPATALSRGVGAWHSNTWTLPPSTSKRSTLPWPHRRRGTVTPLRSAKALASSDWRPLGFLSRYPIAWGRDGGDGLLSRDLHAVLISFPAFARVGLLVILPLLTSGVDTPHEVVGELGLAPPIVLVGWLREAIGPLRSRLILAVSDQERIRGLPYTFG